MTFNSNKSFVGENIRLSNRQSYGNDIRSQLVGGQEAIGTSSNVSSAYKTVKSTGKNEPKKYSIHFLFGNQVTLETPNIWMPEEKFQQMQRGKEYAMKFFRPSKTEMQDRSNMNYFGKQVNRTDNVASLGIRTGSVSDVTNRGLEYLGNSGIKDYFGPDGMSHRLSLQELESGLNQIKKIKIEELTGIAEKILGILSVVKGHPAIIAIHVTIGLCVVAQEVQKKRTTAKMDLEKNGCQPEVIKAYLEDQVPKWFAREASRFFIGNWIGGVSRMITENIGTRVFIELGIDEYYDFLNEYGDVSIGVDQIKTWETELKAVYKDDLAMN